MARGGTFDDLAPKDVNREFVLFMGTMDLNKSPYLDLNIAQFAQNPETVDKREPAFKESNRMHAINGAVYCNLGGLEVLQGRTSRWYVFALGQDEALAAPRWCARRPATLATRAATSSAAAPTRAPRYFTARSPHAGTATRR